MQENNYHKCPCCGYTYFYLRRSTEDNFICVDCGDTTLVNPEQVAVLSTQINNFWKKSFFCISQELWNAVFDS